MKICEKCFQPIQGLGDMSHHEDGNCFLHCYNCKRVFKRASDLKKHLKMQKIPCSAEYVCRCGLSFDKKERLFWHCKRSACDYEEMIRKSFTDDGSFAP